MARYAVSWVRDRSRTSNCDRVSLDVNHARFNDDITVANARSARGYAPSRNAELRGATQQRRHTSVREFVVSSSLAVR